MKVYARSLLDRETQIDLGMDEIVFETGDRQIVISLYRVKTDGRIEIRTNEGVLAILPRAANVVEIESRSAFNSQ